VSESEPAVRMFGDVAEVAFAAMGTIGGGGGAGGGVGGRGWEGVRGRGLHSFTFQLNLSRACHTQTPCTP